MCHDRLKDFDSMSGHLAAESCLGLYVGPTAEERSEQESAKERRIKDLKSPRASGSSSTKK